MSKLDAELCLAGPPAPFGTVSVCSDNPAAGAEFRCDPAAFNMKSPCAKVAMQVPFKSDYLSPRDLQASTKLDNEQNKKEEPGLTTTKHQDIKQCPLDTFGFFHFNNFSAVRGFLQLFTLKSETQPLLHSSSSISVQLPNMQN